MKLPLLLQLAAVTHLGLIAAGLLMPRTVGLLQHLAGLPPFIRQLFWTYYAFIGLCLVGFGLGTFFLADELASGTPLARAVCGFFTVFWTIRLVVAHAVFDLRPYVTTRWHRVGLFLANTVFGLLPFVYGWVAWKGGRP
jgi:hypothetical protein